VYDEQNGQNPLVLACSKGHKDVALLLVSQGAIFDHEDTSDNSVVASAERFGFKKELVVSN
jgi:ankyrin repeat protein